MAFLSIQIEGWDRIVSKYGEPRAMQAVEQSLEKTQEFTVRQVQLRIGGKHTVTGFLRSSIGSQVIGKTSGKVFAQHGGGVYYAPFVEHGTGVEGPRHRPIVPVHARALAWHPKTATGKPIKTKKGGKSALIVRMSSKGQPPVHMFAKTFTEDRTKITRFFLRTFYADFIR